MELTRDGPGLLLRDILKDEAADVAAVVRVVARARPDLLLMTGLDWDREGRALGALAERFATAGHPMAHALALRPNGGMATDMDLDGDGRLGTPDDAQGWGRFPGQGGMALLSRYPILRDEARDFSGFLWRDLPGALLTLDDGGALLPPGVAGVQRLSSTGHWAVPVQSQQGRIAVLAFSATPPVFDGPEDRNGRRNHDEAAFWLAYLDGRLPERPGDAPVILLAHANLDARDGDGRAGAIRGLLAHPRLQDPQPRSDRGAEAAKLQGGANAQHRGNPALDTADWDDEGPGNLRVSYVLPDARLQVAGAGVFWPHPASAGDGLRPRHGLVWVDLAFEGGGERLFD